MNVSIIPLRGEGGRLLAVVHLLRATAEPARTGLLVEEVLRLLTQREPAPPARPAADHLQGLTAREREILHLLCEGASTATIATRLCVAPKTARNHIDRILHKLGAGSRLEAVALALRQGNCSR
ncbi:MAG: helix-turn-helix transcriptional regulator [Chloroflexi bacterium]|nr:helix-turn-helix transcriptional regulator [Chloroflexota bacterium]